MAKRATKIDWKEHGYFVALIALFSALAFYAIFSFFSSANRYLAYVSVVASSGETPPVCQTCPPIEMCTDYCRADSDDVEENDDDQAAKVEEQTYEIFSDLKSDEESAEPVEVLKEKKILNGYEDGTFRPKNKINRAELLKLLVGAIEGKVDEDKMRFCFSDVSEEWFSGYVCFAREKKWVNGFEDGSYKPAQFVNKAQALKMILEALDFDIPESVTEKPFNDVEIDAWFAPYAQVGKEEGIINNGENFNPAYEITRSDFAKMLYKAMEVQDLL